MPNLPHPINITIYGVDNNLVDGATVTINDLITGTTVDGHVVLDAGNWEVGEAITIATYKESYGYASSIIILESAPQSVNLTLGETSDYMIGNADEDQIVIGMSMLTDYDGHKITSINPLPILDSAVPKGYNNPSFTFTRNSNNQVTSINMTLGNETYSSTLTRDSNGYVTNITKWS